MKKYQIPLIILIVVLLWVASPLLVYSFYPTLNEASAFADSFNVINSLFSGLAFAGLIYTIIIQRAEIKRQVATLNQTNKLSYLSTLLTFYSQEEEKYMQKDEFKSDAARVHKDRIQKEIDVIMNENTTKV